MAGQMKCDFCVSQSPVWEYPAQSFKAEATGEDIGAVPLLSSAGSWLACQRCSDMIESGSMNDLAKRSLNAYEELTGTEYEALFSMVLAMHQAFINRRLGPAERITT